MITKIKMVELDYDQVLEELTNFTKKDNGTDSPLFSEILERYLERIAKNGDIVFPWSKVKPFIRGKLELVMDNFYRDHPLTETQIRVPNCKPFDYDNTKNEIMKSFDWFYAAPFTIQRLCELLVEPGKHYHRTDKLMRCIEKNILVVSTVQPRSNKYATPETMERQPNFKDLYPHCNLNNSKSSDHSSSTSSASSSSSTSSVGSGTAVMNGSVTIDSSQTQANNNSYATQSTYHPMSNEFYDQTGQPINNHHSSLLDHMLERNESHGGHHGNHPFIIKHNTHHSSPQTSLAPIQQLDSFTNVFVTTTSATQHHPHSHSHHITQLNSSYSSTTTATTDANTTITNGSSNSSGIKISGTNSNNNGQQQQQQQQSKQTFDWSHSPLLPWIKNAFRSQLPNNDENEDIIVDDDEDENDEGIVDRRDEFKSTNATKNSKDEKDPFFYTTDSSNSNTSDSSTYNSDNSNERDDTESETKKDKNEAATLCSENEQLTIPVTESEENSAIPKKRPSPTSSPNEPNKTVTMSETIQTEEKEQQVENSVSPLTPKKIRIHCEEDQSDALKYVIPDQSGTSSVKDIVNEMAQESGLIGSTIEEVETVENDDSIPMEMNVEDSNQKEESVMINEVVVNDEKEETSTTHIETINDQVMAEPMDQE